MGVLVVAAAGNSGRSAPFFPADYPGVIPVGGTNQSDRMSAWSERGSWVTVSAPGCNGGVTLGQTVTATGTPAGGVSTGSPTNVGQGNGNGASSSLGTVQVGGGNSTSGSTGTVQVGSGPSSPSPAGPGGTVLSAGSATALGPGTAVAGTTPSTRSGGRATTPARSATGVKPAPPKTLTKQHTLGTLPFTGLDLLFVLLAAGGLAAAGLGLRLATRRA